MKAESDTELTEAMLERLPLFPLPRATLLPGSVIPLHLFEPRYRALAEHCVSGHAAMALSTLMPGYEADYMGRPAVYPVMGAGRIVAHKRLADGRWNIALRGICRVRLRSEWPPDEPFRLGRVERLRETGGDGDRDAADRLYSMVIQLASAMPRARPQLNHILTREAAPGRVADAVAALFIEDFEARRALLDELDVSRRLAAVHAAIADLLLETTLVKPNVPLN